MDERVKPTERDEEAKRRASSLSPENKKRVMNALNELGRATEVIAVDGLDSIQRESIQRLLPGQWLNDEVISYFLLMLSKRDEEMCLKDPLRQRCHFFKSFFITKMLNVGNANPAIDGTYLYSNVESWSTKVPGTCLVVSARVFVASALTILMLFPSSTGKDIFNLDKLIIPVNLNFEHWFCAVINMKEKRIQVYDSGSRGGGTVFLESLFKYVKDEHQNKRRSPLPDQDQWRLVPCTRDTPRQDNGTSFISNECFRLLLLSLSLLTFYLSLRLIRL
jgi:sentrin-specific protease 1